MTRSSLFSLSPRLFVLTLSVAASSLSLAAPTTGADGADAENNAGLPEAPLPDATTDANGAARTIRLLLELQGAPPPIEGATDPQRAAKDKSMPAVRPRLPGIELASTAPPSSGATAAAAAPAETAGTARPAVAAAAAGKVDWRVSLPGDVGAGAGGMAMPSQAGQRRSAHQSEEDAEALKALLPMRLIALLREYREWLLLAGVVVLTVLGLSASVMSQRRR